MNTRERMKIRSRFHRKGSYRLFNKILQNIDKVITKSPWRAIKYFERKGLYHPIHHMIPKDYVRVNLDVIGS